ncbi:hypothetical protein LCGC14_0514500 [marine sediment metagenome]|uniref:Uncharacterized protein n=1 Tax=marine sediment metagenome TaxID=412755 RepID=A0A0F9ULT1_9ZZZZ
MVAKMINKCNKTKRLRCEDYSSGTRMPPNHHVRITEKCIYERDGDCVKLGDACEIQKVRRIRNDR